MLEETDGRLSSGNTLSFRLNSLFSPLLSINLYSTGTYDFLCCFAGCGLW